MVTNNWADLGGVSVDTSTHNPFVHTPVPFGEKYQKAKNPPQLSARQREEILKRVHVPELQLDEIELALSVIEFDGDFNFLSKPIEEVVNDWRDEHIGSQMRSKEQWTADRKRSGEEARRLLAGDSSSAFRELDAKQAVAKAAQAEVTAFEAELDRDWREYHGIPKKAEELKNRLAKVAGERARLKAIDYDASIADLYTHIIDPQFGVSKGGNLVELFAEKQLLPAKLAVLDTLDSKLNGELAELRKKDKALSKKLGKYTHNI